MDTIEIKIDDTALLARLAELARAGTDMTPLMREIAGVLHDVSMEAFETEADPVTGAAWEPLKSRTLAARAKRGKSGRILQVIGHLLDSIHAESDADHAVVGTNLVYAAHHQFGSRPDRRHNIPARPFLGLSEAGYDEISGLIADHFRAAAAG